MAQIDSRKEGRGEEDEEKEPGVGSCQSERKEGKREKEEAEESAEPIQSQ